MKQGDTAPEFTLKDQEGTEHRLDQYRGRWVLLYFYPKDDTPGCTKEACTIRDSWAVFTSLNIKVLGVSTDSVKSHAKFVKKYTLPFTLLADEDKQVVEAYGVWGLKKFMGREYMGTMRSSFLIDPEGKVAKVYEKVKPADHAAEIIEEVKATL